MQKFLFAAAAALVIGGAASVAAADDTGPSALHGFVDLSFKNDYITPRGLLVTDRGLTTQLLTGLAFDLYDNATGPINNISLSGGFWNDFDSAQHATTVGAWNEFDYFGGGNVTFLQDWTAGATYDVFLSPPGNFTTERNTEFSLSFNDSPYLKPISIHPYAKLFWAMSGDSTVVLGKKGGTYDVELGMVPTLVVSPGGMAVTLTAPTWITVGPQDYWGGTSNFGVFSTGVQAKTPLTLVPARFGNWYVEAGVQYYNLINDKLLAAQVADGAAGTGSGGHRNVVLASVGIGFGF